MGGAQTTPSSRTAISHPENRKALSGISELPVKFKVGKPFHGRGSELSNHRAEESTQLQKEMGHLAGASMKLCVYNITFFLWKMKRKYKKKGEAFKCTLLTQATQLLKLFLLCNHQGQFLSLGVQSSKTILYV